MHLTGPLVFCFSSFQMPLDHLGTTDFTNRSNCCFFSLGCRKQSHSLEWSTVLSFLMNPLELLSQKAFKAVPSIIGVNNQECGYILPMVRILYFCPASPSTARQMFASIDDSLCDKSRDLLLFGSRIFPLTGRGPLNLFDVIKMQYLVLGILT